MTRKNFKLYLIGEKGKLCEVPSNDYDEDIGLVRYKNALYDIPTGLWVVTLSRIQKGFDTWKGCGSFPSATATTMLDVVRGNSIFKYRLEKQRQKVLDSKLADVVNEIQPDLFSMM